MTAAEVPHSIVTAALLVIGDEILSGRPKDKNIGGEFNEARMRMTRIPAGADLVHNKVSAAPGFWLGNVIVMAGCALHHAGHA